MTIKRYNNDSKRCNYYRLLKYKINKNKILINVNTFAIVIDCLNTPRLSVDDVESYIYICYRLLKYVALSLLR